MHAQPPPPPADALRQRLQAAGVHNLLVQFTDLHGCAKGKLVPLSGLDAVLAVGAGFSGPSNLRNLFEPAPGTDAGADAVAAPLSALGVQFMAGVLAHTPALCALAAPTVNSYKRLGARDSISGTAWAPRCATHGPNNRTALIRTLPGRFEWRLPDASANPYLVIAALIAAGLDGVDRGLQPPPACRADLEAPSASDATAPWPRLPADLERAVDALEADAPITAALGSTLGAEFARLKRAEAHEAARQVTPWELARYAEAF